MNFNELQQLIWNNDDFRNIEPQIHAVRSIRNAHGDSLLHLAAAEGNIAAVKLLLKLGCNPNSQNNFGSPPIDVAAWKGHSEIVGILLMYGADIAICDSTGSTVIDNLNYLGKTEMVSLITTLESNSPKSGQGP